MSLCCQVLPQHDAVTRVQGAKKHTVIIEMGLPSGQVHYLPLKSNGLETINNGFKTFYATVQKETEKMGGKSQIGGTQ